MVKKKGNLKLQRHTHTAEDAAKGLSLRIRRALLLSTFELSLLFCMSATVSSATVGFLATCINDERLAYESFQICGGMMLSTIHKTKQEEESNKGSKV